MKQLIGTSSRKQLTGSGPFCELPRRLYPPDKICQADSYVHTSNIVNITILSKISSQNISLLCLQLIFPTLSRSS